MTTKVPHPHSQETALPLTCDPKSAFSDPRGSTRLFSEVRQAGFSLSSDP